MEILGFIALIIGLALALYSFSQLVQKVRSTGWVSTIGVVRSVEVSKQVTQAEERTIVTYNVSTEYEYKVGGIAYKNCKMNHQETKEQAEAIAEQIRESGQVRVYYNPRKPSAAVIDRKIGFEDFRNIFVTLVVVAGSLYLIASC